MARNGDKIEGGYDGTIGVGGGASTIVKEIIVLVMHILVLS